MNKKFEVLIVKYLVNQISELEIQELESWVEKPENEAEFSKYVKINYAVDTNLLKLHKKDTLSNEHDTIEKLHKLILKDKKVYRLSGFRSYMKYAAIFIGITASLYLIQDFAFTKTQEIEPVIVDQTVLTLEDGSQVTLQKDGSFNTDNAKVNAQEVIYKNLKQDPSKLVYNFLTIPRGEQLFLQLSDSTKVWLNSDTKLKYPVQFKGGLPRQVELVYGEAYFDVSPSSKHNGDVFVVLQNKQKVEVVGTEFNIKAYKEDVQVYTTLVEGKITVNYKNLQKILLPNQQSSYNVDTGELSIKEVEVYNSIAWREGVFSFEDMPLKEIMNTLKRWYDIEVIFENEQLGEEKFTGKLKKGKNLSDVLESIKRFGMVSGWEINDKVLTIK